MVRIYTFNLIIILLISTLSLSCDQQSTSSDKPSMNVQLYKLAHANGCIECHRVKATVVGPSWDAIAKRYKTLPYEKARALLITSVKKGSVGNWLTWKGGEGMPPLEKRVAAADIETLVDYILSLNKP